MPLLDDAIATYEAAARMVARLVDSRTDLLASGLTAMSTQPSLHLSGGYRDLGGGLGICIPADSRATMSRPSPAAGAIAPSAEVLTSELDWMTFEGWLSDQNARICFVEAEIEADRQITADVFHRRIGPDGALQDARPIEWNLPLSGPAVLEVPLEQSGTSRHKIVIHLRRPPERMVLRRLALTALP